MLLTQAMKEIKFIDIRKIIGDKNPRLLRLLPNFILRYIERILHEQEVNEVILDNKDKHNQDFCQAVIDRFNINI